MRLSREAIITIVVAVFLAVAVATGPPWWFKLVGLTKTSRAPSVVVGKSGGSKGSTTPRNSSSVTATQSGSRPAPTVHLALAASADAGKPIVARYTGVGVSSLQVQRQEGTANAWNTIQMLNAASGVATLPGVALGTYRVRLIGLDGVGNVAAEDDHTLRVFGEVPFAKLFNTGDNGVYTLPNGTFPYVFHQYGAGDINLVTVSRNPCRHVHLEFVPGSTFNNDLSGQSGSMTIVQQSADPVSATAEGNTVGTVDASVKPGQTWAVNFRESAASETLFDWYANGTASCDSTDVQWEVNSSF
jgi:hypothetical protein